MTIRVDINVLKDVAVKFDNMADECAAWAGAAPEQLRLPDDAFGRLPTGVQAQADYAHKITALSTGLQQVEATLRQFAINFNRMATNWQVADEDSVMGGQ